MQKSEFEFILNGTSVKYHDAGQEVFAKSLTLYAPSMLTLKYSFKLKQELMRAMADLMEKTFKKDAKKQEVAKESSSEDLITMLMMSRIDLVEYSEDFKSLLLADGICLVDGKVKILPTHINQLSIDDFSRLMGEYILNFFMPSLMKVS